MRATIVSTALVAAILFAGPAIAQQQQVAGTGQFCIKGATGPIKCEYQTMEQCQQARPQGTADQCLSRSQVQSTVGGPAAREQPSAPGEQKD
jgi:Protein of unknown function (DUF3551)